MSNPYCQRTELKLFVQYFAGWRLGRCDRLAGEHSKASRKWTKAYRDGYSDGYREIGEEYAPL